MYKNFKQNLYEEFGFSKDMKRRSALFVSLLKNKDTVSALLWTTGVSILFFNLPKFIGFFAILLVPATIALYLLVAYKLLLSFIHFKLNAFHAQRFFKEKTSLEISSYLSNFTLKFLAGNNSAIEEFFTSLIKDIVKPIWSGIEKIIRFSKDKIKPQKRKFKFNLIDLKKYNFHHKILFVISKSHSDFWLFVKKLVALCTFGVDKGRGFSNTYWNILISIYYKIPLKLINKTWMVFRDFVVSIPKRLKSILFSIPEWLPALLFLVVGLVVNVVLGIVIGIVLIIADILMRILLFIPQAILDFFKSILNLPMRLIAIVTFIFRLPIILFRLINRAMQSLKSFSAQQVILGFFGTLSLLILITLPLFKIPSYMPREFIFAFSEFLSVALTIIIVSYLPKFKFQSLRKLKWSYYISIISILLLNFAYGIYFSSLGILLLFFYTYSPYKKTAYLVVLYLLQMLGRCNNVPDEYYNTLFRSGMIFLLLTDYEEDVEFPTFLFLSLHGSYQELEQILRNRINSFLERTGTT